MRKRFTFYLEHITENIALEKLDNIYNSHKSVFNAMKHFLANDKHRIIFIHGNHDYELLFPEVQKKIKELIKGENVLFKMNHFDSRVYIEHGHQYDVYFRYDPKKVFKDYNGKKELNIPALFSGFSAYFMDSKEWHPFVERIDDRLNLSRAAPQINSRMTYLLVRFFVYQILFSIYNFFVRGYILAYFRAIATSLWNLFKGNMDVGVKTVLSGLKKVPKTAKVVIFGHAHGKISEIYDKTKQRVFVLDTWRDEYSFSDNLKYLVPKTKRFAKIIVDDNDKLKVTLFDYSAKGGKLPFDRVMEDEFKYCKKLFEERENTKISDYDIDETNFTIS